MLGVHSTVANLMELIDGFKRLRASHHVPVLSKLRARVVQVSSRSAKAAVLYLNWVSQSVSDLEEGWVVQSLCTDDGLTQVEVGALLGRTKSWVCRRLSLVERLSEEVQAQIRLGLMNSTAGRELARLPRGNQVRILETIHAHDLCTREVAGLVQLLLTASGKEQASLLRNPRRGLSAAGKWHKNVGDARLSAAGNRMLRNLATFDRACRGVVSRLGMQGLGALTPFEVKLLTQDIHRAHITSQQASLVLEEAVRCINMEHDDEDHKKSR